MRYLVFAKLVPPFWRKENFLTAICSKSRHKKLLCKHILINKLLPLLPSSSHGHLQHRLCGGQIKQLQKKKSHPFQRGQVLKRGCFHPKWKYGSTRKGPALFPQGMVLLLLNFPFSCQLQCTSISTLLFFYPPLLYNKRQDVLCTESCT